MTPTSSAATRPVSIAALGECMLELQGQAFGTLRQTFGGDTLNTAVYLARCGGADDRDPESKRSFASRIGAVSPLRYSCTPLPLSS